MAHSHPGNANTKISANAAEGLKGSAVFHDFFGKGCATAPDSSPAASASVGASSGGGRAPISTTSDLGSGPETSYRYSGSKRCNSDSIMGASREKFPTVRPDSLESSRAMKLLHSAGGERLIRRPYDEEASLGVHPMRPLSASLISQSSLGAKPDANASRWDRAVPINVGPTLQYPPRASQISPYSYQAPSNRFRDGIAGPSIISQAAADEGSRTGIKGSGILSSINASGGMPDRALPGVPLSSCKQKSGIHISEPESSTNLSQRGVASTGRQMTIFYGGQAHVFDDVHPNKADIIMALAGSNGGSWSTTYAPKSAPRPSSIENCMPSGENIEMGVGSGMALLRELQGRSSLRAGCSHASGSGDQISLPPGIHRGSFIAKEARAAAVQTAETMNEEKRDV